MTGGGGVRPGTAPHPNATEGGGNGCSLARRVLLEKAARPLEGPAWEGADHTLPDEIRRLGAVADDEMAKVFNMGIGMVAIVRPDEVFKAHDTLRLAGVASVDIGEVVQGTGRVQFA